MSEFALDEFVKRYQLSNEARRELESLFHSTQHRSFTAIDAPSASRVLFVSDDDSTDSLENDKTFINDRRKVSDSAHQAGDYGRYEWLGLIGEGGMGEVHRVRDPVLRRTMALKLLPKEQLKDSEALGRFLSEAQITSQLQHPGIVPVHELGELPDGRPYFTMKEVRGREFSKILEEARQPSTVWNLGRLMDIYLRVCEAVGYAHARGVTHRDLKPGNIMVGAFGEVQVMDWGLAKVAGTSTEIFAEIRRQAAIEAPIRTMRTDGDLFATEAGTIAGTATYMSPEQATGMIEQIGPSSDVYSLGAMLYEVLAGRPPYTGETRQSVWLQVLAGPPPALDVENAPDIPEPLRDLCNRAMQREPLERPAEAGMLAREIGEWLAGARRREQAMRLIRDADRLKAEMDRLQGQASEIRKRSVENMQSLGPDDTVELQVPVWREREQAELLEREATRREIEYVQALRVALAADPDLSEARERLNSFRKRSLEEPIRRPAVAPAMVREPQRRTPGTGPRAAYLKGTGALTLITKPSADVEVFQWDGTHNTPAPDLLPSRTPMRGYDVLAGSYNLRLRAPDHVPVHYPVHVRRLEHWDGIKPGTEDPMVIALPKVGSLASNEIYVPAGYFWSGGDVEAMNALPGQRRWLDSFIVQKDMVSNSNYVDFLNELIHDGRLDQAMEYAPAGTVNLSSSQEKAGVASSGISFRFGSGFDVTSRQASWGFRAGDPVAGISWLAAQAYAQWHSRRSGPHWRVIHELEWEKAARGVNGLQSAWYTEVRTGTAKNAADTERLLLIGDATQDRLLENPYGIQNITGTIRTWCERDGDISPSSMNSGEHHSEAAVIRGGMILLDPRRTRLADRELVSKGFHSALVGFRLARSALGPAQK